MATLSKGENFVSDPSATGARLNDHVDNATISNVAQADITASSGLIVRSGSAPADTDAGWWDTGNSVFRVHDGASWTPVATGALLTNKSGGTVIAGDVIVGDSTTDNSFTTSTTQADSGVLGVAAESIAADATGVILYGGIQTVLITGTVNRGEFLRHSTTAKKADSTTNKESGSFGIALETGTDTTISALITGTVTSLSASTTETISGQWTFSGSPIFTTATPMIFEGATADDFETSISVTDPTVDRTITLPDEDVNLGEQVIKGWVVFDGTGTPAIDDSFNVTGSITDNGTGDYTVTWDTDFANANYAVAGVAGSGALFNGRVIVHTLAAGSARIQVTNTSNSAVDAGYVSLMAIGNR